MKLSNKVVVIDLEATCWKGKAPENEINEIIEIGICELDVSTGDINKVKSVLVQPVTSKISQFCTELTTITQELIDTEGTSLKEAFEYIQQNYDLDNCTWASYGYYDYNMLEKESKHKGLRNLFSKNHINVKKLFQEKFKLKDGVGMAKALQMLNIPLEGTHHRGVDDAKNIAKILYKIK